MHVALPSRSRQRRELSEFAFEVKTSVDLACFFFNILPILSLVFALSHFTQVFPRRLGQLKRPFVFSLGQNERSNMYFSEVQIVERSFGHLRV